nr:hypothetical protein [uncultured Carboxylicivirga sp.]
MSFKIQVREILIMVLILLVSQVKAQNNEAGNHPPSPIPIEVFMGSESWTSQIVMDKKFHGSNKFGFFGLSYLKANYDNDQFLQESTNLAMLKYDVLKRFSVLSGAMFNSHWGFRPYAGAQYAYHSKIFMGFVNSGFHLTETKNFETIAMLEYRPVIKDQWSLYTRAQGMYSQNTVDSMHDRSHFYGRVGVSYKAFSFGAAYNYDCYGPNKITDNQFGVFISTLL